ncbi:MAG TPA: helix-turn-helix transcriptional regulator [Vicinamibacterales bacterium]|nr:helix-turn-helix transcriptional regulator [Vicinamibacterales bacterium]
MSAREAFGPNLRRLRIQRGLTLDQIAEQTKVSVALWDGLEQNDLSRWPSGVFARAYVREYADIVGVDADATVDEFCRWFPQGDRRAERLIRGQAEIVGHPLEWSDEVPPESDRRAGAPSTADDAKKARPLAGLLRRVLSRA